MPLAVKKQNRESSQSLVKKFTQKLRKSGILLEARKRKFKQRPKSEKAKRDSALRREVKKKEAIQKSRRA